MKSQPPVFSEESENENSISSEDFPALPSCPAEEFGEKGGAIASTQLDFHVTRNPKSELTETERHLLSVTNSVEDAIVSFDSHGTIVFWNDGAKKVFGYDEREISGQLFSIILPESYRQTQFAETLQYLENGNSLAIGKIVEIDGLHKDGRIFPLELTLGFLETDNGKYFTGVMRDITERLEIENALQQSAWQYRFLSEEIKHQVWTARPDGKLDYVNQRTLNYFGKTNEEIIGDGWQNFIQPDDLQECLEKWNNSLSTGEDYDVEFRLKNSDGEYLWHQGRATAGLDADGNIVKWFGTNSDIHKQKQVETALRESEERFRLFMNNSPAVAFMKDEEGRYVYFNETMKNIFNIKKRELLGKSAFGLMPQEEAQAVIENDLQVIREDKAVQLIEIIPLPDGEHRSWLSFKFPMKDSYGKRFVGGVAIDITEREHAEKALKKSENKIRTLLDSMSEGLIQVSPDETVEFVNNRFCTMLGYETDEILGKTTYDFLFDGEDHKTLDEANIKRRKGVVGDYELKLKKKSGELIYVIVGGAPLINDDGQISGTMGVFTDITERKRAEDQLLHDAFHDTLTGLANRALFMDHLRMTIERRRSPHSNQYAVLFLDFDRFKIINDSLGHAEGDELLRQIAKRLASSTRTGDLVARLGGDEFVILLNELVNANEALLVAERILEDLKLPFNLQEREIFMTASIGIALSTTGHQRAEDMLRDADIAMYQAKSNGKAQFKIFDRTMHEEASKQLLLETEMRRALDRGEFEIHYQPIIILENNTLKGFEALVRWRHPQRGLIYPGEFIPVAEENGLIHPLGAWILRESCRQMNYWHKNNPQSSHLSISVNLSAKQFSQSDLANQIADALEKTGLNPNCLRLEITESELMQNSETTVQTMKKLHKLGIRWSLDDFGTGYSSLRYLHQLPFHLLKIDRSFINQMMESNEKFEIVSTIVKLAKNLKMLVVAEGIENTEQLSTLKEQGCELGQGFLFSKPLDADKAQLYIEEAESKNYHIETEAVV